MIITIDGPAGAGKSTVAKLVAKRLSLTYLDTGATYRAFTWKALQEGIPLNDEKSLADMIKRSDIMIREDKVILDGVDITGKIRSQSLTNNVHYLADSSVVRAELVILQQEMGKDGDVVSEGRDQGTVVFPNADKKFYLDASVQVRARRRYLELMERGEDADLSVIEQEIELRDERDKMRAVGALKKAEDAVYIDTSDMTIDEVVEKIVLQI